MPASDVYSWAKQVNKPTYTATEVGAAASGHDHDGTYLKPTGDGQNVTTTFTQATSRSNISSGEKLSSLFGKVNKWFTDLGTLAFKNSIAISEVNNLQTTLNGKAAVNHTHLVNVVCAGRVKDDGTPTFITGCSVSRTAIGVYKIIHNLGTTNYGFIGNGYDSGVEIRPILTMRDCNINYCVVDCYYESIGFRNGYFSFMIFKL